MSIATRSGQSNWYSANVLTERSLSWSRRLPNSDVRSNLTRPVALAFERHPHLDRLPRRCVVPRRCGQGRYGMSFHTGKPNRILRVRSGARVTKSLRARIALAVMRIAVANRPGCHRKLYGDPPRRKIAQPAVNQSGRARRRACPVVALVDEQHGVPPCRQLLSGRTAIDPRSDHSHVEAAALQLADARARR